LSNVSWLASHKPLSQYQASARYSLLESSLKLVKSNDLKMRQRSLNTLDCTGANINLDDLQLRILPRSEEHTSELQSRFDLVCRLLLEKKKNESWIRTDIIMLRH